MGLSRASLGLKLNLALVFFFLMLGGLTVVLILYGFNRTRDNAAVTSEEGLEDFGSRTLGSFARLVSAQTGLEFARASQSSELAVHYLVQANASAPPIWDSSNLISNENGVLFDPSEDRLADFWIPSFLQSSDRAKERLQIASHLELLFPAMLKSVPEAAAVYFAGSDGEFIYYPSIGIQDYLEPDTNLWSDDYQRLRPENNPDRLTKWVAPYDDLAKQGKLVSVASPIYIDDEFLGIVGFDISLDSFIAQVDGINPTEHGYAFYIDSAGKVLPSLHSSSFESDSTNGNESLTAAVEAMRNGETGQVRTSVDGVDVYLAFAPVPEIGGSLALVGPVDDILDEAQADAVAASIQEEGRLTLQVTLLAMGALFCVGLIGATYLNRRLLIRPIEALVTGTRAVAQGDFETQIPVRGNDELATLGHSFNQMTSDIQQEVRQRETAQGELAALFAAMTDRVVVVDNTGRFLRVPQTGGTRMLEDAEPVEGKLLQDVRPPAMAEAVIEGIRNSLASRSTLTIEFPFDLPDGSQRWLSSVLSPLSETSVVAVVRDITDRVNARQELERQVEERTRELTALLSISNDVASTLELGPLLSLVIDEVKTIADYHRCSIFTLEGDSFILLDSRSTTVNTPISLSLTLPSIESISSRILRQEPVIIEDVRSDTPEARAYQRGTGELFETAFKDVHSWMAVPLALKDRVIGMLTLSHTQPAFYTERQAGLVGAIATQIAVAIENARLYEQAQQLAAVEERQRLARELHDSVSQALYGIALGARTARTLLDSEPARAIEPVDYVLSLAEAGLAEMRALIFELRPESLETEGLVEALLKQTAATRARYGLDVRTDLGEEPPLGLAEKEVFYRVAQEALHNVVKHAHASQIDVRLASNNGAITLEVQDDGGGFNTSTNFPGHMGLVSMRERATSLGASLDVESTPGAGTTVRLSLANS